MGSKLGAMRPAVEESHTRPQGLYQTPGVDLKRLRKLILSYKLAPCCPGEEDGSLDLEECPICFLYYPSLNRSRCCAKGMCTECYLQLKSTCAAHVKCPFCKAPNFDMEYRGVKTNEEKRMEQIEEQKVIEAYIRKRQQELNDEKEKYIRTQFLSSPNRQIITMQLDNHDLFGNMLSAASTRRQEHDEGFSPGSLSVSGDISLSHFRDDSFDDYFDDIMLEEAIWLSIQEQGYQATAHDSFSGANTVSSPSGGLASAIAALSARQHVDVAGVIDGSVHVSSTSQQLHRLVVPAKSSVRHLIPSPKKGRATFREEGVSGTNHNFQETGTSYATSIVREHIGTSFPACVSVSWSHLPESYEGQLRLALAISAAETGHR